MTCRSPLGRSSAAAAEAEEDFSTMGARVKKGRHRRFEEARALKRLTEETVEPCAECGAEPGAEHASWCLATEDLDEEEYSDPEPHRA
jgi:hypothetical protein